MKKKISTVIIFMLAAILALSASTWKDQISRNITLQGGYGTVIKAKFERIPTQSSSFTIGMPFDIEGRLVQYNKTSDGREIAYWSIISNQKFDFTISAQKLTSEEYLDAQAKTYTELDYILTFTYTFGYAVSADERGTKTGSFSFDTETNQCTYVDPNDFKVTKTGTINTDENKKTYYEYSFDIIPEDASTKDGLIGSVNGSVYFMFTQNTTNKIEIAPKSVVSGNYSATITMTVTPND